MPVVKPGSRILVTGGNSYVGVGTIHTLLQRGFSVRATVRSREKNLWLEDLFKEYKDKFELVVVEDIKKVCMGEVRVDC
jgi:NADPH:quinone reductase-like Zn-dependent oxidoreductase